MSYSVVLADLQENRDEIVGFWQNSFPAWPRAKYEWFYEGNPCGSALCFVMRESEGGRMVGAWNARGLHGEKPGNRALTIRSLW